METGTHRSSPKTVPKRQSIAFTDRYGPGYSACSSCQDRKVSQFPHVLSLLGFPHATITPGCSAKACSWGTALPVCNICAVRATGRRFSGAKASSGSVVLPACNSHAVRSKISGFPSCHNHTRLFGQSQFVEYSASGYSAPGLQQPCRQTYREKVFRGQVTSAAFSWLVKSRASRPAYLITLCDIFQISCAVGSPDFRQRARYRYPEIGISGNINLI